MKRNFLGSTKFVLGLILAVLALASFAAAQSTQVKGLITGRSGSTMTVKTQDSETITVALSTDTQVQEVEGAFQLRKKELGMTALIPGLPVEVKGSMNDGHQLVADSVRFKGSDLKTAQDIQAGLAPTEQQVQANQAQIQAAEKVSEAHQQEIAANQAKIAANQAAIAAAPSAAAPPNLHRLLSSEAAKKVLDDAFILRTFSPPAVNPSANIGKQ